MLTPADIENRVFKKVKLGGYDINDVEDFLEKVIVDYENLFQEVTELKDRSDNLQESVKYYKSLEQGIDQTINNAKEEAERMRETAMNEATEIRERKEKECQGKLAEIDLEIKKKQYDLEEIKKQMQIYKIKVRSMLEAEIKILDEED